MTASFLVGAVFGFAAIAKAFALQDLADAISLSGFFPKWSSLALAIAVFVTEAALAFMLLTRSQPRLGSQVAIVILAGFTIYLTALLIKFRDPPECGCMSSLIGIENTRVAAMFGIVRNLTLIGLAAYSLTAPRTARMALEDRLRPSPFGAPR